MKNKLQKQNAQSTRLRLNKTNKEPRSRFIDENVIKSINCRVGFKTHGYTGLYFILGVQKGLNWKHSVRREPHNLTQISWERVRKKKLH